MNKECFKYRYFYYFRCHQVHGTPTKDPADVGQGNMGNLHLSGLTSGDQGGYRSVSQMTPDNRILIRTEPLHISKMKSNLYAQILFMCILCYFTSSMFMALRVISTSSLQEEIADF